MYIVYYHVVQCQCSVVNLNVNINVISQNMNKNGWYKFINWSLEKRFHFLRFNISNFSFHKFELFTINDNKFVTFTCVCLYRFNRLKWMDICNGQLRLCLYLFSSFVISLPTKTNWECKTLLWCVFLPLTKKTVMRENININSI